jgi:hypothetical protein
MLRILFVSLVMGVIVRFAHAHSVAAMELFDVSAKAGQLITVAVSIVTGMVSYCCLSAAMCRSEFKVFISSFSSRSS